MLSISIWTIWALLSLSTALIMFQQVRPNEVKGNHWWTFILAVVVFPLGLFAAMATGINWEFLTKELEWECNIYCAVTIVVALFGMIIWSVL